MAVNYSTIKSMKTAKVGTIMPWAGDGNFGFLQSNVPRGWILCDGTTYPASRYPLLASVLGDTYGGSNMAGTFPDYTGTFKVPNMTSRCPMDLEPSYVTDSNYQYGQSDAGFVLGSLVSGFGLTTPITTLISADSDIDFTVDSTLVFVGKMTNITFTQPDFNTTVYTVNRKLGINHTPSHSHPGLYDKATVSAVGPMPFGSNAIAVSGTASLCSSTKGFVECQLKDSSKAPSWAQGKGIITYYGSELHENTLVTTDRFWEFNNPSGKDYWGYVPAVDILPGYTASTWKMNVNGDSYTSAFAATPKTTHKEPAWTGMFPRPNLVANRRNYFGYNADTQTANANGIFDDPESASAAFTINSCVIPLSSSKVETPAGASIGTNFDAIKPFMWVTGTNIPDGTQVLSINRKSGTSTANYVYEIELSNSTTNTTATTANLTFRNGTFPTTLNNLAAGQNPNSTVFGSHNHGSFDVQMAVGSLAGPATHPVSNISIGNVTPENIPDALNIIADISAPSLNVTYIIKAY
jgi:hypothetical protein